VLLLSVLTKKAALIGLGIIAFFSFLAIAAPVLTPFSNAYSPTAWYASYPYSVPSWATFMPWYSNYSHTVYIPSYQEATFKQISLNSWRPALTSNSVLLSLNESFGPSHIQTQQLALTLINTGPGSLQISSSGNANVTLSHSFYYKGIPQGIYVQLAVFENVPPSSLVEFEAYLVNPLNQSFWLLDAGTSPTSNSSAAFQQLQTGTWTLVSASTLSPSTIPWSYNFPFTKFFLVPKMLTHQAFSKAGVYKIVFVIHITTKQQLKVYVSDLRLVLLGQAYGVLGTDVNGASVWSQFVYGARTSLLIGLVASILIITIGLFVGLFAGYFGGVIDLSLIAINDILLVIPFLPLLITLGALVYVLHVNLSRTLLIILLITLLSWPGTARVVRSQTLSLKNKSYVKAAQGFGASSIHIILHHILPELSGIIFAQLAIDVPAVIAVESGLDFLGLGITSYPTWGNMIGLASSLFSAQNGFLWWWILPPGVALTVLGIAFYVFGEAVRQGLSIKRA
jgi:peptide/nickel transport system permease protein